MPLKISQMPPVSAYSGNELVPVVQSGRNLRTTTGDIIQQIPTALSPGSGVTNRPAAAKLQESISVRDFGAVGDGTTDDAAAFAACAAQCIALGLPMHIPPGTFATSQFSAVDLQIYGERNSTIRCIGGGTAGYASGGASVSGCWYLLDCEVFGLNFTADPSFTKNRVIKEATGSSRNWIHGCTFTYTPGVDSTTCFTAVYGNANVVGTVIEDNYFLGYSIYAASNLYNCRRLVVQNNRVDNRWRRSRPMVSINNASDRYFLEAPFIVGNDYVGYQLDDTGGSPHLAVIDLSNIADPTISNNRIDMSTCSGTPIEQAVHVESDSLRGSIVGNRFIGGKTAKAIATQAAGTISAITVQHPGWNYSTPPTVYVEGGGTGSPTLSGIVDQFLVTSRGSGYTISDILVATGATLTLTDPTGSGASLIAYGGPFPSGGLSSIAINNGSSFAVWAGGSNYTNPSLSITGSGTGAAATPVLTTGVTSIAVSISANNNVRANPFVYFKGGHARGNKGLEILGLFGGVIADNHFEGFADAVRLSTGADRKFLQICNNVFWDCINGLFTVGGQYLKVSGNVFAYCGDALSTSALIADMKENEFIECTNNMLDRSTQSLKRASGNFVSSPTVGNEIAKSGSLAGVGGNYAQLNSVEWEKTIVTSGGALDTGWQDITNHGAYMQGKLIVLCRNTNGNNYRTTVYDMDVTGGVLTATSLFSGTAGTPPTITLQVAGGNLQVMGARAVADLTYAFSVRFEGYILRV